MALRNAFVLNGAALFALTPVYLALAKSNSSGPDALYWPASLYVAGIAGAALSCLFAYANFQILAEGSFDVPVRDASAYQALHNQGAYERLQSHFDERQNKADSNIVRTEVRAKITAGIAVFFAVVSFASFIMGYYWLGDALISTN